MNCCAWLLLYPLLLSCLDACGLKVGMSPGPAFGRITASQQSSQRDNGGYVTKYHDPDIALRVYTSLLLGREPRLVLHGGGNTSVKTMVTDLFGDKIAVLR